MLREHGEDQAIHAAVAMQCGLVVDQGSRLALAAAGLPIEILSGDRPVAVARVAADAGIKPQ